MLGHPLQWDPWRAQQPLVAAVSNPLHAQMSYKDHEGSGVSFL